MRTRRFLLISLTAAAAAGITYFVLYKSRKRKYRSPIADRRTPAVVNAEEFSMDELQGLIDELGSHT